MQGPDKTVLAPLKGFFKANPGAAFVVAFQLLLISAAILLASGNSNTADKIAVYAFYALAIGIVVQIGITFREEKKHARAGDDTGPSST